MYSSYESPSPSWKEPLSKVIPQNCGIPRDLVFRKIKLFHKISVFRKIKLFHKIAVFYKNRYSIKSSYSDITHFLYSACILQSPVSHLKLQNLSSKFVFKMMTSSNSTNLLVDSNLNTMIEISIINCLYIPN